MEAAPAYESESPRTAARLLGPWTRLLPVFIALVTWLFLGSCLACFGHPARVSLKSHIEGVSFTPPCMRVLGTHFFYPQLFNLL